MNKESGSNKAFKVVKPRQFCHVATKRTLSGAVFSQYNYVTVYAEIGHLSKILFLKLAMDYENITPDEPS